MKRNAERMELTMFDQLTDMIVNYVEVKKEDIRPESRFIEDLGFTSFDFMSLLGEAEDVLDVEINQELHRLLRKNIAEMNKVIGSMEKYVAENM